MSKHNDTLSNDMASQDIASKERIRREVYQRIHAAKAARFPFPIEGRIPNFVGAEAATRLLRDLSIYQEAEAIKVNPDAPQLPVRAMILADGKTLYMPSPRLRGAFLRIRPSDVPTGEERRAASLSHCQKYGTEISIEELAKHGIQEEPIDLIVTGSVAVTRSGVRAGKGEGYADLEYAILQELGLPHIPVITTVHPSQIVADIPVDAHDLSLDYIVTPDEVIKTDTPRTKPTGIRWDLLDENALEAMPVLRELRNLRWESFTVPDLIGPDLRILFVGINPGRKSAIAGHHFAGPGNHFWRLLADAGLTPRRLAPEEEHLLLQEGLGITNIVSRASRGEDDLTWDELVRGGQALRSTIEQFRPQVVALLGKNVYRAYAGLSRSTNVPWGLQKQQIVSGIKDFVAPNPSARSTIPYEKRLEFFLELKSLVT